MAKTTTWRKKRKIRGESRKAGIVKWERQGKIREARCVVQNAGAQVLNVYDDNTWHTKQCMMQHTPTQANTQSECVHTSLTCLVLSPTVNLLQQILHAPAGHCGWSTPISPGLQHDWQRTGWSWYQRGLSPQPASKTESAVSHGCWVK